MDSSVVKHTALAAVDVKTALEKARAAKDQFGAGIKTIRAYIAKLQTDIAHVLSLPVDEETAQQRFSDWLKGYKDNFGWRLDPETFARREFGHFPKPSDAEYLLLYLLDEYMGEAMSKRISHFYKETSGITGNERAAELGVLRRNLLDAELAEESLIRAAESAGFKVSRRPDADPKAVLAASTMLP